ncbi:MAG: hypothetical protein ACO26U_07915 [Burkholderiaceae bacterium]
MSAEGEVSMNTFLDQPLSGPGAWKGDHMRQRQDWIITLSQTEIAEIDQALACGSV